MIWESRGGGSAQICRTASFLAQHQSKFEPSINLSAAYLREMLRSLPLREIFASLLALP